jgi:hypothetical protein
MFTQTWKKYLPVIIILLKRSVTGEQSLNMNHTDFERAAGGRKIKYSFSSLKMNNGRIDNTSKHSVLAMELMQLLQENEQTRPLIRKQDLEFSMNNGFQLLIKNNTIAAEPVMEAIAEEVNENADQKPPGDG